MAGLYPTVKLVEVQQQFKTLPAFYLTFFGRQINFEEDKIAFDKVSVNYKRLAPFVAPNVQGRVIREKVSEMAPELVAAEGYLHAGQSLIQSELGKRLFQSPEEKLWYMSRRHPPMRDPEVKGGYLDAITSAAPR